MQDLIYFDHITMHGVVYRGLMDERFYNDVLIVINVEKEYYHSTMSYKIVSFREENTAGEGR